jgi:hypothetical protein
MYYKRCKKTSVTNTSVDYERSSSEAVYLSRITQLKPSPSFVHAAAEHLTIHLKKLKSLYKANALPCTRKSECVVKVAQAIAK